MNTKIKMLDTNAMQLDSNYISNVLHLALHVHERYGDGLAVSLQLLLELQALIDDEIEEIKDIIIADALDSIEVRLKQAQ